MGLIQYWISECLSRHPKCSAPAVAVLPDRVLDMTKGRNPSLHINSGNEQGKYAALSHCWGGDVALKLTNDNIGELTSGVSFDSLPKTFQDAVEVCRLLDIPYLWIDSLCIIQTSKADWEVQGSKMHMVYSQAFLVIAADGARDSREGFLRHPNREVPSLTIPFTPSSTVHKGGVSIHVRKKGVGGRDMFFHHSRLESTRSNLSTRGWVLQESVLAPRIVHFTAEEVTWECNELSRCECQVAPHSTKYEIPVRQVLQAPFNHALDWRQLVHNFTCRNLSYATDRLAAMSGLAASMQPGDAGVKYYAGLWSDSLPHSLFWLCVPHGEDLPVQQRPSRRVRPASAPSWSWGSVTGRVVFGGGADGEQNLRDMAVFCPPSDKNKYTVDAGGTLTANAKVLRGKIFHNSELPAEKAFQVQFFEQTVGGARVLPPVGGIFLDVIGDGNLEVRGGDEVSLVAQRDSLSTSSGIDVFLVLKPEEASNTTYSRVGLLMCNGPPESCLALRQTVTII